MLLSEYLILRNLKSKEKQVFEEGLIERTHSSLYHRRGFLLKWKKAKTQA